MQLFRKLFPLFLGENLKLLFACSRKELWNGVWFGSQLRRNAIRPACSMSLLYIHELPSQVKDEKLMTVLPLVFK